jgi:CheY-like chemotaxis protein
MPRRSALHLSARASLIAAAWEKCGVDVFARPCHRGESGGAHRSVSMGRSGHSMDDPGSRASRRKKPVTAPRPFVAVVDDDESVRDSLPHLLKVLGFDAESFVSADAFLASDALDRTDCLILDVAMPGMGGPELKRHPRVRAKGVPVIFITASQEDGVRRAMQESGAVECLTKPFGEEALVKALGRALRRPPNR